MAHSRVVQLTLTFVGASLLAISWELSGRRVLAPIVALALVALDTYALRPDTELTRATLRIDGVLDGGATTAAAG